MSRILLVDDDDQLRELLRIVLHRAGHEVQEAHNGDEAIEIHRMNPTDLVITDIIMPDKEGLATIREFRRDHPHLKIIAMSGGGRVRAQDYLGIAKKFGADYDIAKPFSNQEILELVNTALDSAV
jgi:DNA-binding NtrC family response regulator